MRLKRRIFNTVYHTLMMAFSLLMIYPLVWLVMSSFKPTHDIMPTATKLIPEVFTLENYANGWKGFARNTFGVFFKNSIIISVVSTVASVVGNSLRAFGFARINFPGRKIWFAVMLSTMCLPGMVLNVPKYLMYNSWGWVGTYWPILLPGWFGGAFNTFLLMQFMRNIPKEMDEAAEIDGCGWWQLFTKIMLPMIKPALASVAIFAFMGAWNDYMSALLYLNKTERFPVAFALKLFTDEFGTNYGPQMAMSVLSLIPIMILFFIFQKQLVEGISTSGLKG